MKKTLIITPLFLLTILFLLPITAFAQTNALTNEQCLSCHGEEKFLINRLGQSIDISVEPKLFNDSIHGSNSCTTCHPDISQVPHKTTVYGYEQKVLINSQCMTCHEDLAKQYKESAHGKSQKVFCSDCHGSHKILKKENPSSNSNRLNISTLCMNCHDGEIKEAYMESFHGKANHLGSKRAPSCADCHGSHNILGPNEPGSMVSKAETPNTCAKCHLVARPNFAEGLEHTVLENKPGSAPMYYTFKFFIWLTIIVISLLFIHMELELYRIYKQIKKG